MNGDDITLKRDFLTGDTENLGEAISGTQERNRAYIPPVCIFPPN